MATRPRSAELKRLGRGAVTRIARWSAEEVARVSAVDLAVQAALTPEVIRDAQDPVTFVRFLRAAWQDQHIAVSEVTSRAPESPQDHRFDTLLRTLTGGVPPFSVDEAIRHARVFDSLATRREPFDRPTYSMDVAQHALIASSGSDKGRILAATVRFLRSRRVVDIGTAYGMSALYLASQLPADGKIVTLEASEPQLTVSAEVLKDELNVVRLSGRSHESVAEVEKLLGGVDLVCHDGAHSREAYIADFEAYLPLMSAGSAFFLDDIRWEDETPGASAARTYEGWQAICQHSRVRRAVELDGCYGLLQLS